MAQEIKLYDGDEGELVFVRKFSEADTLDPRWRYCVDRHRGRWAGEKPPRRVPFFQHEGQPGWWFPSLWVADFARMNVAIDRRTRAA